MIKVTGVEEFCRGLEAWGQACGNLATETFRGLSAAAFKYVVEGTPEWSGNLTANWRLTTGPATGSYTELFNREFPQGSPFNRHSPNPAAISYAYRQAQPTIESINLLSKVTVFNCTPYAADVEKNQNASGKAFVRAVNFEIEMTHAAETYFNRLGGLSTGQALKLASGARLGGA